MSLKDPESRRPDHPDFMDYHELKARKFSGIRVNELNKDTEIWVDGEIRKRLSQEEMFYDPELKIAKAYQELFLLNSDVIMEDRKNVSSIIH